MGVLGYAHSVVDWHLGSKITRLASMLQVSLLHRDVVELCFHFCALTRLSVKWALRHCSTSWLPTRVTLPKPRSSLLVFVLSWHTGMRKGFTLSIRHALPVDHAVDIACCRGGRHVGRCVECPNLSTNTSVPVADFSTVT